LYVNYFEAYYFVLLDSERQRAWIENIAEGEKAFGLLLLAILAVYLRELSMLFGTTKKRIFWSIWVSNLAGYVVAACGAALLIAIFALLRG
jgi:hypothetical protein